MKHLIFILFFAVSCSVYEPEDSSKITSITIVDNSGFTETISSKDRLEQYQRVDFLRPQSFQKVLRVFGRDKTGNVIATLTSYHPNGHLRQYLEAKNNNAFGSYQEWYPTGTQKLEVTIISGVADLSPSAEQTWLFDGCCLVWNEDGSLEAKISYNKGLLDGPSLYYHKNSTLWKCIPYSNGVVTGTHTVLLDNGQPLQTTEYKNGFKHGPSIRYWPNGEKAAEENYTDGLLTSASYYNKDRKKVAQVENGNGFRALFGINGIAELQQYKQGIQEGVVKTFNNEGDLVNTHHIKDGLKHGEEIEYQEKRIGDNTVKPKLLITWFQGTIQGVVKTWFDNGALESQREMSRNLKNGLATAWYKDGSLMMIEEYEQDVLVRGEYYKIGDKHLVSQVWEGEGIATLYDSEGNFSQKITYHAGKPQE